MDKNQVEQQIKDFLENSFPNPNMELTNGINIFDDWDVDSLGIVNIIAFLEKTFGIEIKQSDINLNNFENISALSNYVMKKNNQT
ncbi:MAG: acyl carrier protein [Melioribacteraceae bacterium]|nr:acyl carrier protein [Melioribacteraceae bacterium]